MFRKKKEKEFAAVGSMIDGLPVPALTTVIAKLQPDGFSLKGLTGTQRENWP